MAMKLQFLVFLAFLAITNAARDAEEGEFPFQVSVRNLNNEHLCGGVIITSKWVLTSSECMKNFNRVQVAHSGVDFHQMENPILSKRIEIEKDIQSVSNVLALIELEEEIRFNNKARFSRVPRQNIRLANGTISGWAAKALLLHQWNLKVIDTNELNYVTRDCRTLSGNSVSLAPDQFCLVLDAAEYTSLASLGAIMTRGNVLIGLQYQKKLTPLSPIIFVELSHHGQWIEDTLQEDANKIQWANSLPSSASLKWANSLAILALSFFFIRFF